MTDFILQDYLLVSTLVTVASITIVYYVGFREKSPFPVVGKAWRLDYRKAMEEGVKKYPNEPFIIPFMDPTVIIPNSWVGHMKNLPVEEISNNGNMIRRFAIDWTGSGYVSPELSEGLKQDLSRSMHQLIPIMEEEIRWAVHDQFGSPEEWTDMTVLDRMGEIIALVTGRIFVGLPLSRDPRWRKAMQEHTNAVMGFATMLRIFPLWLRPYVGYIIPGLGKVERTKREIGDMLHDRIEQKIRDPESETDQGRLLSYVVKRYQKSYGLGFDKKLLVRDYFTLTFAAVGIPAMVLTHIVFDLASNQELFEPLRNEYEQEVTASLLGKLDQKSLARMVLLDSCLKESMRMNPPGLFTWLRMTHRPQTLPSGHVIPPNMLIATTSARYNKNLTHIKDADKFNPRRYIQVTRDSNGKESFVNTSPLSSTSQDDLLFGYGTHACPGRFFAAAQLKILFAELISRYDFVLEEKYVGNRPENRFIDFISLPPSSKVRFRMRKTG